MVFLTELLVRLERYSNEFIFSLFIALNWNKSKPVKIFCNCFWFRHTGVLMIFRERESWATINQQNGWDILPEIGIVSGWKSMWNNFFFLSIPSPFQSCFWCKWSLNSGNIALLLKCLNWEPNNSEFPFANDWCMIDWDFGPQELAQFPIAGFS